MALQQFDEAHNSAFYSEALSAARLPSASTPSTQNSGSCPKIVETILEAVALRVNQLRGAEHGGMVKSGTRVNSPLEFLGFGR